jgi:hypothetical protein
MGSAHFAENGGEFSESCGKMVKKMLMRGWPPPLLPSQSVVFLLRMPAGV